MTSGVPAMTTHRAQAAEVLYAALAEPIGLVLRTSDTKRVRQHLYAARRAACDPALEILSIRISPFPEGDLVIVRTGPVALALDS